MYSVPREQLVRPGQRRSLMRRALVGIVPDELLNRKRKAYIARGPMAEISADWPRYADMTQHMLSCSLGIVEAKKFLEALQKARHGEEVPVVTLMRTLGIENWLQKLKDSKQLNSTAAAKRDRPLKKEGTVLPHKGWKVQPN
jgi:asparagine synthase (glutamine-hydrolysing)